VRALAVSRDGLGVDNQASLWPTPVWSVRLHRANSPGRWTRPLVAGKALDLDLNLPCISREVGARHLIRHTESSLCADGILPTDRLVVIRPIDW